MLVLNQQLKRVELKGVEIENEIVFEYFNKLDAAQREEKFFEAIYIGVLAQMQERLQSFFAKTSDELGARLESLKVIFELKRELFYKTALKGGVAEGEVAEFLREFCRECGFEDEICEVGTQKGTQNKKGDITATLANGEVVAIECKFNKQVKVGDFTQKDIFAANKETLFGELLEAGANRKSKWRVIVFDEAVVDKGVKERFGGVGFAAEAAGFVAVINSQNGDFTNLATAYNLAREFALSGAFEFDPQALNAVVGRLLCDLKGVEKIKTLATKVVESGVEILDEFDKRLHSLAFTQAFLQKVLTSRSVSAEELLEFYKGEAAKEAFASSKASEKN